MTLSIVAFLRVTGQRQKIQRTLVAEYVPIARAAARMNKVVLPQYQRQVRWKDNSSMHRSIAQFN